MMRPRGTWLLIAAVALLGVAAALDVLRGEGPGETAPSKVESTVRADPLSPSEQLEQRGVSGVLYFSRREGDGCRLYALTFGFTNSRGPLPLETCHFQVSPRGKIAAGDRCPEPTVALDSGAELRFFEGCAPAWKPNETLTFVQGGGVAALLPLPPEGGGGPLRVVFSRRDFLRQMRAARPRFLGPFMLEEIACVTDTRLVAIVRFARRFNTLALFEKGKLVARTEPCCPPVSYLRALPGGRVFAGNRTSTGRSLLLFDRLGRFVTNTSIPAFLADGRAFTESPDGRWTASTLPDSIQIYRSNAARPLDPVDLPLRVVDLGWASR